MKEYPQLSDNEYIRWRELIRQRIGLNIRESGWPDRDSFLRRRLNDRMKKVCMSSYDEYYRLVEQEDTEWENLSEILVNGQSGFFRHAPSFEALMNIVLPEILAEKQKQKEPLKLWSVGCSKGQEVYSLAMACDHVFKTTKRQESLSYRSPSPRPPSFPPFGGMGGGYYITGIDISRSALERANSGVYSMYETRDMLPAFKDHYLEPVDGYWRIKDSIRKNIRFCYDNIMSFDTEKVSELADIIFCQNVFIYFDIRDRVRGISGLLKRLRPGGYLFLAPGESVGIRVGGAVAAHFKDTLSYRRTMEDIHVQINQ